MAARPLALALTLTCAAPALAAATGEEAAESAYFDGLDHFRARELEAALDAFERVLGLGPTPRQRARALQGFARSALQLAETRVGFACARLAGMGRAFEELDPGDPATAPAQADAATLRARCDALRAAEAPKPAPPPPRAPRVTPPTHPDYAGAWILTASAGLAIATGLTLEYLALDALEARGAAVDRYRDATSEGERIEAARAVGRHDGTARTRVEFGYALLGLGGLLGAAAVWAWVDPPEVFEAPFAIAPTGTGLTVRATW
ncbi:MAG: hypothetical protein R3F65_15510 [bacterium]